MTRCALTVGALLSLLATPALGHTICGDGVISPGEPCDRARLRDGCAINEGCIEQRHRCRCAPSCEIANPSEKLMNGVQQKALKLYPRMWGDAEQWEKYWNYVEDHLGCSLRDQTRVPIIEQQFPESKDPPIPPSRGR
jgi:hypothetical protein